MEKLYACPSGCGLLGTAAEMQEHMADPHFTENHQSAPFDAYLPFDPAVFEDIPNSTLGKIRCRTCGATGYRQSVWLGAPNPFWWGLAHTDGHRWPCSDCDRIFTTAGGLHTHRRRAHHTEGRTT